MKSVIVYILTRSMLISGGVGLIIWHQNQLSLYSLLGYALGLLLFIPASIWWLEFFNKKIK